MTLRNPYITTHGNLTLGHGTNVWTDDHGDVCGIARLGDADLTFHASAQVREVIAYLTLLAAEMDTEAARHEAGDGDPDADPPPPCPECEARQPFHTAACSWRHVSDTLTARAQAAEGITGMHWHNLGSGGAA